MSLDNMPMTGEFVDSSEGLSAEDAAFMEIVEAEQVVDDIARGMGIIDSFMIAPSEVEAWNDKIRPKWNA